MCSVRVLCPSINPSTVNSPDAAMSVLEDYGNEPVGFLQFFNSWKKSTEIRRFLSTSGLPEAAAKLLGCKQVRLYQVRNSEIVCVLCVQKSLFWTGRMLLLHLAPSMFVAMEGHVALCKERAELECNLLRA